MPIKSIIKYHYTPIRMAKIWNTCTTPNAVMIWDNKISLSLLVGMKNDIATLEDFDSFLQNLTYFYHMLPQLHSFVFPQRS